MTSQRIIAPGIFVLGEGGQNGCSRRAAALCAAIAAIAVLIATASHPPFAYADGGASARNQTATSAPDHTPATPQARAQRILRALADDSANKWVRYWQARAVCDAAVANDATDVEPVDRVLIALTDVLCAQLDARLGVDPADHPPRGDASAGGLLINEPGAAIGYTLFALWGDGNRKVYLIDPLGRLAHKWHIDETLPDDGIVHAKLLDNGNLLIMAAPMLLEIDMRGNIVWQYDTVRAHHDFLKMPNGNLLLLYVARKSREEAIAAGANPEFVHETGIHYDYLVEVRPSSSGGEIVWQWSPWDHLIQDFDPSKPNYGAVAEHPELIDLNFLPETLSLHRQHAPSDWLHANAIDYNPALDQVMMSPRHYSELWVIDHSATTEEARGGTGGNSGMGGDLLYRWGNPRAYGQGDADDQRLFWQHHTHWIPPGLPGAGNILAFSNGNEFADHLRGYSSVDEIAPPVDGYRYRRAEGEAYSPDQPAWTYADAEFYAPYRSGAHRLPNGNTLIADGVSGTIFQATPNGKVVWKYIVPWHYHISLWQNLETPPWLTYGTPDNPQDAIKNDIYRAYQYPPDHPGLQSLGLAPGAYLQNHTDPFDWARESLTAGDFGEPRSRSRYDIYLDENALIYYKRPCAPEDAQARFYLHIYPTDASVLPPARQKRGFDNSQNFQFPDAGKISHDSCIAIVQLPPYPIQSIHTGQFAGAQLWRAEIELGE